MKKFSHDGRKFRLLSQSTLAGVLLLSASVGVLVFSGCALTDRLGITETVETQTVNPTTGETVVETERVLTDEAETVIDETTAAASNSGGLLGILGVAAGAAFGIWRKRKENSAVKTTVAVVEGVSEVLKKIDENQANGTGTQITADEAKQILKTVQENEGVRDAVRKILKNATTA